MKYALNTRNGKLHANTCHLISNAENYHFFSNINHLLADFSEEISLCKVCLKNDSVLQVLIKTHNQCIARKE